MVKNCALPVMMHLIGALQPLLAISMGDLLQPFSGSCRLQTCTRAAWLGVICAQIRIDKSKIDTDYLLVNINDPDRLKNIFNISN